MDAPKSRRPEVVVQKTVADALNHQQLAASIIRHMEALPLGSVISIQGSWGRGKTDILARTYLEFESRAEEGRYPRPLWLNPWQYGTPDLIRPVVLTLLSRFTSDQRQSKILRRAVRTLLLAGNAMLFKALTVVAPFGEILGAAQGSVDDFLKGFFDSEGQRDGTNSDADPVAAMAQRFRELVDEYIAFEARPNGRLVVCIDDLDRCLPDHQIAMLEAIYFLTSAGANCSFLVALDPALVQQAAVTHYRTAGFDSSQYLDKLFDLRINLRTLRYDSIGNLLHSELEQGIRIGDNKITKAALLAEAFSVETEDVESIFGEVMGYLPELSNPRLVHRISERVQLLARASLIAQDVRLRDREMFRPIVIWCTIAERWPQLRQVLQATDEERWNGNLYLVTAWYNIGWDDTTEPQQKTRDGQLASMRNFILRLPDKEKNPDLGQFIFDKIPYQDDEIVAKLALVDQVMLDLGL